MAQVEAPNRVDRWWEQWSRAYPQPPFESDAYNERKLKFLEWMRKEYEKLPRKTKEEEASMRRLDREAQELRKARHPGTVERFFSEQRNPVARFITQLLKTIREMGNDRREKAGLPTGRNEPKGTVVDRFPQLPEIKKERGERRLPVPSKEVKRLDSAIDLKHMHKRRR